MPNRYFVIDIDGFIRQIDLTVSQQFGYGIDTYIEVLRVLEEEGSFPSLTYYLSVLTPAALPTCGPTTVLVLLADEYFVTLPYFKELLAVFRCYGERPVYLDGIPTTALRAAALVQSVYKTLLLVKRLTLIANAAIRLNAPVRKRPLWVPLGCFAHISEGGKPFRQRAIDFAFLGSVGSDGLGYNRFTVRSLLTPPKIRSRSEMLAAASKADPKWTRCLTTTNGFIDSISQQRHFSETLGDTKISICPRGSSYETYRFFESCKAGCVVVCEPLPKTWFYEGHPGITIRRWSKLPNLLDDLLRNQEELEQLSASTIKYWKQNLSGSAIAARVSEHIQQSIHNPPRQLSEDSQGPGCETVSGNAVRIIKK